MKIKHILLSIVMACMTIGCTAKDQVPQASTHPLNDYNNLTAEETYDLLLEKMNSDVQSVETYMETEDMTMSHFFYKTDNSYDVVIRTILSSDDDTFITYAAYEGKTMHTLSQLEEKYVYYTEEGTLEAIRLLEDYRVSTSSKLTVENITRKDYEDKIELQINVSFENEFDGMESISYVQYDIEINELGFVESETTTYYADQSHLTQVEGQSTTFYKNYNQGNKATITEHVQKIQSLDGVNQSTVLESIGL